MHYSLHCFAQSGNAYKAALMLNLCQADWEPVFVDFFNGATKKPDYLALNEMGEVPLLQAGKLTISQTGVILDYLAEKFERFGAGTDDERREILRWLLFDNHKLTSNIATLRFLRQFTDQGESDVTAFLEGRAKAALSVLERRLNNRQFVLGDRPTIADISLCGYLYFTDELGFDLNDWPECVSWLSRIAALPGWVHPYELMPGHPR